MGVNWREVHYQNFVFNLAEIGIVPTPDQVVEVFDLWTHQSIGTFDATQTATFAVRDIPGHGNFTFRFHITDAVNTHPMGADYIQ